MEGGEGKRRMKKMTGERPRTERTMAPGFHKPVFPAGSRYLERSVSSPLCAHCLRARIAGVVFPSHSDAEFVCGASCHLIKKLQALLLPLGVKDP